MQKALGKLTRVVNSLVESATEVLSGQPYCIRVRRTLLSIQPTSTTDLPVVLSRQLLGSPGVWLTASLDLTTALNIADRSLKASGKYAMGFSTVEQDILKQCYEAISRRFATSLSKEFEYDEAVGYIPGSARLSFGRRVATVPSGWPEPFVAELDMPEGLLQLCIAIESTSSFTWHELASADCVDVG